MSPIPKKESDFGIVLLAAGSSSRLGSPKQLLEWEGYTFIKRAALVAMEVSDKVVVVTGAQDSAIKTELQGLPLVLVENDGAAEGIASSIRLGLNTLTITFAVDAVVFMVCDQPYLTPEIIFALFEEAKNSQKGIVASAYGNTLGIPALFRRKYFPELLDLKGDTGAKKLIMQHLADTSSIPFPKGSIDIDTAEDWDALI